MFDYLTAEVIFETGDVLFSTKNNCKVTVNKVSENGILCDWFVETTLHREIIEREDLSY